jgi:hypothetical protein
MRVTLFTSVLPVIAGYVQLVLADELGQRIHHDSDYDVKSLATTTEESTTYKLEGDLFDTTSQGLNAPDKQSK